MNSRLLVLAIAALMAVTIVGCDSSAKPASPSKVIPGQSDELKPTPVAVGDDAADSKPGAPKLSPTADDASAAFPEVVARVDDQVITGKQFTQQLRTMEGMLAAQGTRAKLSDADKSNILDGAINTKVLAIVAKKAGLEATEADAKEMITTTKGQLPPGEFEKYLKQMEMTEDELVGLIREQKTIDTYIKKKADVPVTDEDIKTEYELLKTGGMLDRAEQTVTAAHILIMVDQNADEAAWQAGKAKIDAARARVIAGENFAAVAKEVSQDPGSAEHGGVYDEIGRGKMVPEFEDKMFSSAVGEVSEPFKTKFGWHILTVLAKHEPGTRSLEEVKEGVKGEILQERQKKIIQDTIDEARSSMKVEVLWPAKDAASGDKPAASDAAPVSDGSAKSK